MPALSEPKIKAATPPSKGYRILYDAHRDAPPGFGLRITAAGTRAFILRYYLNGTERRLTIGEWGAAQWSLAAARQRAGEYREQIDAGVDVVAQRRQARRDPTVRQAVENYCTAHVDSLASGPAIRGALERYLVNGLGSTKLKAIRRRDVIEVIETVARDHPRMGALLLGYIKGLFAWAEDRELIDANPAATLRPQKIGKHLTPRKRGRILNDAEVKAFWQHVEHCGLRRLTALALKLILVTGQRPGEVAGMRWDEIDANVWTIPAERRGKTESAHTVPLTDTALEILEAARAEVERLSKRRKRQPEPYVFPVRPGRPMVTYTVSQAVRRRIKPLKNLNDATWGHWTPHDLRRTCHTHVSVGGLIENVADLVIGHSRKRIAAGSDLRRYDVEKRAALEAWEWRLLRIVSGKTPLTPA